MWQIEYDEEIKCRGELRDVLDYCANNPVSHVRLSRPGAGRE